MGHWCVAKFRFSGAKIGKKYFAANFPSLFSAFFEAWFFRAEIGIENELICFGEKIVSLALPGLHNGAKYPFAGSPATLYGYCGPVGSMILHGFNWLDNSLLPREALLRKSKKR